MDRNDMRTAIAQIRGGVEQAINANPSPGDKMFTPLVLAGIDLLGELLLDIKRIADAMGPPDLADAVERVARLLAKREAERKFNYSDAEPGCSAQLRWIDGNWHAFEDEAAELLAAAVPGTPEDK